MKNLRFVRKVVVSLITRSISKSFFIIICVRVKPDVPWEYQYDAENRLVQIDRDGLEVNRYLYDGDGNRVAKLGPDDTGTIFIGNYFEAVYPHYSIPDPPPPVTEGGRGENEPNTVNLLPQGDIAYYYAGSQRIAMRDANGVYFLLSDHLGSSSVVIDAGGQMVEIGYYLPWGGTRGDEKITSTDYGFTGQMREGDIYFYNARWYDPGIGRFMQADTIVPLQVQGTQAFDRYAYINNNPVNGTDPSGHYLINVRLSDGGGVGIEGLFNEAYRKLYNDEPPGYSLRSEWSNWTPGSWTSAGGEGFFNEQSNPNGWRSYGLLPKRPPLNKILHDIVVHHIGDYAFGIGIRDDLGLMKVLESSEQTSGYYDIAYHYGIGPGGEVFVGRNIGVRGAHVEGGNTGRVGIVLLGAFDDKTAPTDLMVKSLTALSVALSDYYRIQNIIGHRELNQTLCPGDSTMEFIEQIQRELLPK